VAGFYSARGRTIPPLPWPTFAPPLSDGVLAQPPGLLAMSQEGPFFGNQKNWKHSIYSPSGLMGFAIGLTLMGDVQSRFRFDSTRASAFSPVRTGSCAYLRPMADLARYCD